MTTKKSDLIQPTFDTLFELIVRLGDGMQHWLGERGLTTSRAEVLFRLHGQGAMVQRELSEALRCTPRHVTQLVDQLEQAGLVARKPHPSDRRAILVTPTAKGTKLADEMYAERARAARDALGDVSAADLEATLTVLRTILHRMPDV